jgi:hypothetical protein
MGERVSTTDLYESTFYLLSGCALLGIEAERINGTLTCRLTFSGENLAALQSEYFSGKARVLLFPFRRSLGQVNALVYSAKKKARNRLREQEQAAQGGAT